MSIHDGVQQVLQLRATQVPDFLRMVFFITGDRVTKRADLIVENKRSSQGRDRDLFALGIQTHKQAQYVFLNDDKVQVVGCLMAMGEEWAYREITRNKANLRRMEEQVRDARGKDTVYSPSPEPTNSSSSFISVPSPPSYPLPICQNTDSEAFLELQQAFPKLHSMISIRDEDTPRLLGLVKKRLKEINPDLWPGD